MYRRLNLIGLLVVGGFVLTLSCKKDKPQPSSPSCPGVDTMTITYQGYVASVMRQHCTGCHGGSNPSKGIALETYDQLKSSALSGKWYATMANGSMPPAASSMTAP